MRGSAAFPGSRQAPLGAALVAVLCTIGSGPAHAGELPANRHISTVGQGEVRVKPDTVMIRFEVSATERSSAAAKQAVDERVNRFLAAAEDTGIDRESINAGHLQISPRWEYRAQERVFAGYQATRNLNVRLTELDALSHVIDLALGSGISNVQQLHYEHSEGERLVQEAHRKAVENSKSKAESLAAAYGARLGLVYAIHYQRPDIELPPPVRAEAAMMRAADMEAGGVYLQEEIVFRDSIEVVFDLTFAD